MPQSALRIAFMLGLLSVIGPIAIDMYLPALPQIGADLNADMTDVQLTLAVYFVAFGGAQILYGPLADHFGRRPPLFIGLTIFAMGALGSALAPSVDFLMAARFLQGLGGASIAALPRAVVRDLHKGPEATRLMARIMLVVSIGPMLAPLAGSGVLMIGSWRWIFVAMVLIAAMALMMVRFSLPETLPPEHRVRINLRSLLQGFRTLLTDFRFLGLTLVAGFSMASFFVFLATSSYVYIGYFGLTPLQYSAAFAANAVGFFGASQIAARLGVKFGPSRVVANAMAGFAIAQVTLLMLAIAGFAGLFQVIALLFIGNAFLGLVIPTCMVMALDDHGRIAGLASSLGGTIQMTTGAVMIAISSIFFDGTVVKMVVSTALCAGCGVTISMLTFRRRIPA